jgi:hypothetical protein
MTRTMKVEFTFSLDDLVDVTLRGAARHPGFLKAALHNAGLFSLCAGMFLYAATNASAEVRAATAIGGAALAFCVAYLLFIKTRKDRARALSRNFAFGLEPFKFTITIESTGVTTNQFDTTVIRPWSLFEAVFDNEESIDLMTRQGDITAVRNRAFSNDLERTQFLGLARSFLKEARVP